MAVISAAHCEVEIQEQTDKCSKKYCVFLKYEPEEAPSTEIATVILTNKKPIVKQTKDLGTMIIDKSKPPSDMNTQLKLRAFAETETGKKINWSEFFGNRN
jgi:O-phosphoseryl-tRNA(Cys) synthetase